MSYAYNLEAAFEDDAVESGKYLTLPPPGNQYPAWVVDVLSATSAQDLREALGEAFDDECAPTAPFHVETFFVPPESLGAILSNADWSKLVHIGIAESAFRENLKAFRREHGGKFPPRIGSLPNVREFVRDGSIPSAVRMMMLKMGYARLADAVIYHLASRGERHRLVPDLLEIVEEGTKVKNQMFEVLMHPKTTFRQDREEWLKSSLATAITGDSAG